MIEITLPMSISVNVAYAGKTRRFKSNAYKEWEQLASTYPQKSHKFKYTGKVLDVHYSFYSRWYNKDGSVKMKDVANYIKVVDDYLPNVIDGFDDKFIFNVRLTKIHSNREIVKIKIKECNDINAPT